MESMGSNSVWSLVEAPKGVKPSGSTREREDQMGRLKPSKLDWWKKVTPKKRV